MNKSKISYGQFSAILLTSDAFALICYSQKISIITILSFLISMVIQVAVVYPVIKSDKSHDKKWILLLYLIVSILWGALLFVRVWHISDAIYIPLPKLKFDTQKLIISALIAIVCLYASSPGIKALSRASVITAGFGILCIIIVALGSIKSNNIENLYIADQNGIASQITYGLSLSGSICIFPYLSGQLKDSKTKSATIYFICRAVLFTGIIILTLLTTGGIMKITDFPIIKAVELCQPFNTQRTDALFILVLVLLATVAISSQIVISSQIIESIFPKFRRFKSSAIISVTLIVAVILGKTNIYNILYAIIFLLPAVAFTVFHLKNSVKGGKSK